MIACSWIANLSWVLLLLAARVVSAQAPQNISVSPQNSGGPAGVSQQFTFTFSDQAAGGASNIDWIELDFGPVLASGNSCFMYVTRNSPGLYLMNSDGSNLQWTQPAITPGSGQTNTSNPQSGNTNCMISGAGFTVTTNGNNLTVTVPITFSSNYTGTQNIYMIAHDVFGQYSGWTTAGTWTVGTPPPANVSVSPSSGGASAGVSQPFTFTFYDQAASTNIDWIELDFGPTLASGNSCFMYVTRNSPVLYLMNSDGSNLQWTQPAITPGSGQTNTSNPQSGNTNCMISGAGFNVTSNGNTLTVTVPITFSSNYTGTQNIYMIAHDVFGQYSGWTQEGTWTVGAASGTVTATAVNPPSGSSGPSGSPQQFTVHYKDTIGFSDISYGVISFLPLNQSGCAIEWYSRNRALNLIGLGGSHIDGTFGQVPPTPLSNAYCSVDTLNSQLTPTGDGYDVSVRVTFAYQSTNLAYEIYATGENRVGTFGPWADLGSWTSTAGAAPAVTLTNTSNSAINPNFVSSDSYNLTISGNAVLANRPVTLNSTLNGVGQGTINVGTTDANGNFTLTGTKNTAGNWTEQWYVGGVAAASTLSYYVTTAPAGYNAPGFPSIPGSFTAPAPSLSCDNISSTWIVTDQVGNQQEWTLQQSLNGPVSGFMAFKSVLNNLYDCGNIRYDVTGSYTGTSFSLSASNPQPSVDACMFAQPASYSHTLTLSGASCSAGSSTWDKALPQSNESAQLNTALPQASNPYAFQQADPQQQPKATWTSQTPRFSVQYSSYIPVDHVPGPTGCLYGSTYVLKIYKGDAFRNSYRTTQSIFVIPDKQTNNNFYAETGATRNYGAGSPANGPQSNLSSTPVGDIYNGLYIGSDEDNVRNDCYLWNASDHGDTNNMQTKAVSYPTGTQAQVNLYGLSSNPLEPSLFGIQSIRWNMTAVIDDSNPTQPTGSVNITHTCYPAHIVKVNGTVVYEKQPEQSGTIYIAACLFGLGQITGQASMPVPAH